MLHFIQTHFTFTGGTIAIFRRIRMHALAVCFGLFLAWMAAEVLAYLILKNNPRERLTLPEIWPETPAPPSAFALPESLSKLPRIAKHLAPELTYLNEVMWVPVMQNDRGVWAPPRQVTYLANFIEKGTEKIVAQIFETTDKNRRRVPPWHEERRKTAKRHLLALGCSLTWGQGVGDSETMPALIAKDDPDLIVHNAAFGGYGPAELLVRMKYGDLADDLGPSKGAAFYYFFKDHFFRFFNSASKAGGWRPNGTDLKEIEKGFFEPMGQIQRTNPGWIFFSKLLLQDPLARLFDFDYPFITDSRLDTMMRAVKEMREIYWRKTRPENPFVVVLAPIGSNEKVRRALDRAGLLHIDYSKVNISEHLEGPVNLPWDTHPSVEHHSAVALSLKRDLHELIWND